VEWRRCCLKGDCARVGRSATLMNQTGRGGAPHAAITLRRPR
jgi:hypothetical protein